MERLMFRCLICGYIHEGNEPPKECPICGATQNDFEQEVETLKQDVSREAVVTYRCLNCEYIHEGDVPPEICPVCGFTSEHFEYIEPQQEIINYSDIKKVVVIGGGIAAVSAVETLRQGSDAMEIILITNEEKLPYYRLNLTRFLSEDITEGSLCIHGQYWYDEHNIKVFIRRVVTDILPSEKKVILSDNSEFEYDKLIVALGAHPFIPPIVGVSVPGIVTLRAIEDADFLMTTLDASKKVIVIGGGVLGLEAAGALATRGIKVTVAEGSKWLMPRQLNAEAGLYVEKSLKKLSVDVEYEFRTTKIEKTSKDVFKVYSKDGRVLKGDSVLIATGVRPNTYLARKAGLVVDRGLVVNNNMQTSEPDIYAAGDVTEHYGITYGLWNIAQYQGRIAGLNILGDHVPFGGVPRSNALKVLDIDVFSIGEINPEDASYLTLSRQDEESYLYMVIRDQQLVGSIAIGYKTITHKIKKLVEQKIRLTPEQLTDISYLIDILES